MTEEYSMLIQKSKSGSPLVDIFTRFGIAVVNAPIQLGGQAKETPTVSVYGEHGERSFYPDKLYISAYDMDIEFTCKGNRNATEDKYRQFLNYLTGFDNCGTEMKIYIPWTGIGRQCVRFKSASDFKLYTSKNDESLNFKVTFRVADPVTNIVATTNGLISI